MYPSNIVIERFEIRLQFGLANLIGRSIFSLKTMAIKTMAIMAIVAIGAWRLT